MNKKLFEQDVKPGDLIFLITDHSSDRLAQRIIRSGIYLGSEDPNYGQIRPFATHVPPFGREQLHGWDFSLSDGSFAYKEIKHYQVVLLRDQIAELVGSSLDDMAQTDYQAKL